MSPGMLLGFGCQMTRILLPCLLLVGFCQVAAGHEPASNPSGPLRLLEDEQLLLGTVEEIRGPEVRVNTGDLMPRYLSFRQAGDKHPTTPRAGDTLLLIVNDQNTVIEYHLFGEGEWHILVKGKLLKPLPMEQYWALIQFHNGTVKTTPIDAGVWNKVAALPVGTPATFLLDNTHTVIDVTR